MSEKPSWWPQNPYPEDIFTMTREQYIEAVPDPGLRTAITGCLARWAWGVASDMIWDALRAEQERREEELERQE